MCIKWRYFLFRSGASVTRGELEESCYIFIGDRIVPLVILFVWLLGLDCLYLINQPKMLKSMNLSTLPLLVSELVKLQLAKPILLL